MGWEVHLTRADFWPESAERPITADEWLAIVEADHELRIDAANGPYFAVWSGACSYPEGAWFEWSDGQVSTKNPDRAILGKLLQLADRLGAVVQGDDGEVYSTPEDLPIEEADEAVVVEPDTSPSGPMGYSRPQIWIIALALLALAVPCGCCGWVTLVDLVRVFMAE